jgi:two-component system, NarL family, nitrate/nitrite response regulator NarL
MLIDDHAAYRQSLRIALSRLTGHRVVGEAGSAREGCRLIERRNPALAIVDFFLGDSDGVSLVRELKRRRSRTSILMLGRLPQARLVSDALKAGARGYVLKTEPLVEVIRAVDRVESGAVHLSPQVESYLQTTEKESEVPLDRLSHREREIFYLLVDDRTSKEIAQALCISTRTVDAHRLQINRKLAVHTRSKLTRRMADLGILS